MEKFLLRRSLANESKDKQLKQARYLSKYSPFKKPIGNHQIPSLVSALEPPLTHMQIIEKCPIQLNQIKRIKNLRMQADKQNTPNTTIDEGVLKKFKVLKKVFNRTNKAQEMFIQNHSKKQIKKYNTSHEPKRDPTTKFCPPPFGYYDKIYSQVQRRIPSLNISRVSYSSCQMRSLSPSIEVKYDSVYPRPISFNMAKQLSRDKNQNNKNYIQPDIKILQAQYEFNSQQQKKYSNNNSTMKLKLALDKKIFPYSMAQISNMNIEILRKYQFNQNDKKFAFIKRIATKKD